MILIAGGTGFVGSHLVSRLINEGHKVRCVVSRKEGKGSHLQNSFFQSPFQNAAINQLAP